MTNGAHVVVFLFDLFMKALKYDGLTIFFFF